MRIIVSFTSYPPRINSVHKVVESLYRQTVKADEIVLYLSLEEFPEAEADLPATLKSLIGRGGFRVAWVHGNLKSHKKYFYALQEYRDAVVITVDDDTVYSETMISELAESHRRFPDAVSARNVRIILKKGVELAPYRMWERENRLEEYADTPRMDLCAIGNGGICYPAVRKEHWFDETAMLEKAEAQDDLWLKYNELVDNIPVVYTKSAQKDITIESSQTNNLAEHNLYGEGNDRCIYELSALFKEQDTDGYQQWFRNLMTQEEYIAEKKRYYAGVFSDILDRFQNVPIYIYGAGKIAKDILMVLTDLGLAQRMTAVIVTDKAGNPPDLYGLQVRSLSELNPGREFGVIFGVSEVNKKEIMVKLADYHYLNIELDMQIIMRYYPH